MEEKREAALKAEEIEKIKKAEFLLASQQNTVPIHSKKDFAKSSQ